MLRKLHNLVLFLESSAMYYVIIFLYVFALKVLFYIKIIKQLRYKRFFLPRLG